MNRNRSSMRSRGSNSTNGSDPREKVKDCCRKLVAFMCTQVGVGALIVGYAIIGAFAFQAIETHYNNTGITNATRLRENFAFELWNVSEQLNTFNREAWILEANSVMENFQNNFTEMVKEGYEPRPPEKIWTFSAALMFCLSIFSMIGYGNTLPKTTWGKVTTMIYATFGIPLYILYFMNMGKVLAATFKWLYTWFHDCSRDPDKEGIESSDDGTSVQVNRRKKVIVPSTACLWVISFYIAGGTIMFAEWESWEYPNAVYFVVISLCKIGFGDMVPGAGAKDSEEGKKTKLVINFVFILFGMGLVAMCYILMREEVREKFREIKEDAKLCLEDISQKFARCFGNANRDDEFEEKYY